MSDENIKKLVDTTKNGKLIDIIHKKTRVCVKIKKKRKYIRMCTETITNNKVKKVKCLFEKPFQHHINTYYNLPQSKTYKSKISRLDQSTAVTQSDHHCERSPTGNEIVQRIICFDYHRFVEIKLNYSCTIYEAIYVLAPSHNIRHDPDNNNRTEDVVITHVDINIDTFLLHNDLK
ncbi:hypothetical protein AGLY_007516 [Aphis glycines]|uniref:Uncharacterized protein n=1 Tax=Aphis glycines TaxID=307491 RepID=A0A6G0TM81_APHGL|nr:hypothetical protein AGLY_007516 [Aphis glycines]